MGGRREFLRRFGALATSLATPASLRAATSRKPWDSFPFSLGVASGAPLPDGVVLWTRIAPAQWDGEIPDESFRLRWEIARDPGFGDLAASGTAIARPELAHSVHLEAGGLAPGTEYHYRFIAGDAVSPAGRTRTAPAAGSEHKQMRFAFASCQHFEHGYFGAYRHMAEEGVDLVVFLGDYIYEYAGRPFRTRTHQGGECLTLSDYRRRHAQYKGDQDLQRMHAAAPWLVTWDDHEVQNDYANDRGETLVPAAEFLARRAAAYQAYFEHMPLRPRALLGGPGSGSLRIHEGYDFGRLMRIHVLDGRQHRSHQVCPRPGRGGSNTIDAVSCPERLDPARSLLGTEQERWLAEGLCGSAARWNVIAQTTRMAQLDVDTGDGRRFWTDGWDGYPAARERLLRLLGERRIANPVVIGGDVHSNWVSDLKPDFDDPRSPVVATEFCGTSISSPSYASQLRAEAVARANPHVRFVDMEHRGYAVVEASADRMIVRLRAIDDAGRRSPEISTLARFEVLAGQPGAARTG